MTSRPPLGIHRTQPRPRWTRAARCRLFLSARFPRAAMASLWLYVKSRMMSGLLLNADGERAFDSPVCLPERCQSEWGGGAFCEQEAVWNRAALMGTESLHHRQSLQHGANIISFFTASGCSFQPFSLSEHQAAGRSASRTTGCLHQFARLTCGAESGLESIMAQVSAAEAQTPGQRL